MKRHFFAPTLRRACGALGLASLLAFATGTSTISGASAAPSPGVVSAKSPTITWKTTVLAPSTKVAASTLVVTNSKGTKTWTVTGNCTVKKSSITTKESGTCKVKLAIAAKGAYKAKTSTKTMQIVSTSAGSLTASGCPTSVKFPDLSAAAGPGSAYAKPKVSVSCGNDIMTVTSNGMTGYTFVPKTPNALKEQAYTWKVSTTPKVASSATSIKQQMGTVAFTVTGIPIFGPMEGPVPPTEAFGDPVYNNILDTCKGHTGYAGDYHHHAILAVNDCYLNETIVGYALDGFPIYSNPGYTYVSGYKKTGDPKSNAWNAYTYSSGGSTTLDECNGRTDESGAYRYYITEAFPYIIGCFKGTATTQVGKAAEPMVMKASSLICEIA